MSVFSLAPLLVALQLMLPIGALTLLVYGLAMLRMSRDVKAYFKRLTAFVLVALIWCYSAVVFMGSGMPAKYDGVFMLFLAGYDLIVGGAMILIGLASCAELWDCIVKQADEEPSDPPVSALASVGETPDR